MISGLGAKAVTVGKIENFKFPGVVLANLSLQFLLMDVSNKGLNDLYNLSHVNWREIVNKLTGSGVLLALSGMVLLIFKVIAMAVGQKFAAADISLIKVLSDENLDYLETFSSPALQSGIQSVITTPLYLHLIIVGIILAIIGGLLAK